VKFTVEIDLANYVHAANQLRALADKLHPPKPSPTKTGGLTAKQLAAFVALRELGGTASTGQLARQLYGESPSRSEIVGAGNFLKAMATKGWVRKLSRGNWTVVS
jgi:hypothetical protein